MNYQKQLNINIMAAKLQNNDYDKIQTLLYDPDFDVRPAKTFNDSQDKDN